MVYCTTVEVGLGTFSQNERKEESRQREKGFVLTLLHFLFAPLINLRQQLPQEIVTIDYQVLP
jgi:hypothetical protein